MVLVSLGHFGLQQRFQFGAAQQTGQGVAAAQFFELRIGVLQA